MILLLLWYSQSQILHLQRTSGRLADRAVVVSCVVAGVEPVGGVGVGAE